MIKIGLQALSLKDQYSDGRVDIEESMELAHRLRLDGIDLEDRLFQRTDREYTEKLKLLAQRLGLKISYVGVIVDFSAGPESLPDEIERAKSVVDLARAVGSNVIRLPGSGVPVGWDEARMWPLVRDKFIQVAEYASGVGVRVGLHNHNHGATPATGDAILRMLREVGHPNLVHITDTGQFQGSPGANGGGRDEDPVAKPELYESIRTAAPHAVIVRAKFYRLRDDGSDAWLDYGRILPTLEATGFNGWISLVYEGHTHEPSKTAVPRFIEYLHSELSRRGLR